MRLIRDIKVECLLLKIFSINDENNYLARDIVFSPSVNGIMCSDFTTS